MTIDPAARAQRPSTAASPAGDGTLSEVWMSVKHAARAVGVSERTAFRWARKGVIPVRRSGKTQLIETGALRAYASRPANARVAAAAGAVAPSQASVAVVSAPSRIDEVARIADWDERLCVVEEAVREILERVMRIGTGV